MSVSDYTMIDGHYYDEYGNWYPKYIVEKNSSNGSEWWVE